MVQLQQIITELQKLRRQRGEKYEKLVRLGKMNHYTRESKLAVWDELLKNCFDAQEHKRSLTEQLTSQ